jgi:hypothetical protein
MCYNEGNVLVFVELGGVEVLVRFMGKLSSADMQVMNDLPPTVVYACP